MTKAAFILSFFMSIPPIICSDQIKKISTDISAYLLAQNEKKQTNGFLYPFAFSQSQINLTDNEKNLVTLDSFSLDRYIEAALRVYEEIYRAVDAEIVKRINEQDRKLMNGATFLEVSSCIGKMSTWCKLAKNIVDEEEYLRSLRDKKFLTEKEVLRLFRTRRIEKIEGNKFSLPYEEEGVKKSAIPQILKTHLLWRSEEMNGNITFFAGSQVENDMVSPKLL